MKYQIVAICDAVEFVVAFSVEFYVLRPTELRDNLGAKVAQVNAVCVFLRWALLSEAGG